MIENARYTESGSIAATIDGIEMTIPNNLANRHRGMLAAWEAQGGIIAPLPTPSFADKKAAKLAALAEKRWHVETGGIVVAAMPIHTDDRSKLMITGARIKADADAAFSTQWVTASGSIVSLGSAQIIAISDAVLAHVDACFARFAALAAAINGAADEATLSAIDINAGWPANS